jgi:hypothetical protein
MKILIRLLFVRLDYNPEQSALFSLYLSSSDYYFN